MGSRSFKEGGTDNTGNDDLEETNRLKEETEEEDLNKATCCILGMCDDLNRHVSVLFEMYFLHHTVFVISGEYHNKTGVLQREF